MSKRTRQFLRKLVVGRRIYLLVLLITICMINVGRAVKANYNTFKLKQTFGDWDIKCFRAMSTQENCKEIGANGCLLLCEMYLARVKPHEVLYYYELALERGIISKSCYIYNHKELFELLGMNVNYIITSEPPLSGIYIDHIKKGNYEHYIIREGGSNFLIYDPNEGCYEINTFRSCGDYRYIREY